jgi:RNA-binding protein YhbY
MRRGLLKFQIGKNGVNDNFITTLQDAFKNHKQIRISVLKSAVSERNEIEKIARKIVERLKGKIRFKTIGFTIVLLKR